MKKIFLINLILFLMVFFMEAGSFKIMENRTIKKTLEFKGGSQPQTLEIDNIFGAIHVEGDNGKTVRLTAQKTIRARSEEKLKKAQEEVKLDISIEGNYIGLYVDGPFRKDEGRGHGNFKKQGYIVQYNFELKVPYKTDLSLKTVTDGDIIISNINGECELNNVNDIISVDNLEGDFDVHTVNGGIKMREITGSGKAHTVNGKVTVFFVKNPVSDCSFRTLNGKLDVIFRPGLSADFKLKTFNGNIYSDFHATYLPLTPAKGERKNGKYVYKSNRFQAIRIGKGGPKIKMDTLNGNIYINKGE